ncbi:MAG: Ig-like domain-containing protein [Roseivirga sp.]
MKLLKQSLWAIAFMIPIGLFAQKEIVIEPANITMDVGEKKQITAYVTEDGKRLDAKVRLFSRARKSLFIDSTMTATAYLPGTFNVIAIAAGKRKNFEITVNYPPVTEIQIDAIPDKIYAGTPVALNFKVLDKAGLTRDDVTVAFSSKNEKIARVDNFGNIMTLTTGKTTITAKADGIENTVRLNVVKNPITRIELSSDGDQARTGDVFHFTAKALDAKGNEIADAPVIYSFNGKADDVSSNASGMIKQDGRFVADEPGIYTVTASVGVAAAQKTLRIKPRNVSRKIEQVGHGSVNDKHTSDFWIWEGQDGRDYGVTGTWGADGTAYFWDVTDPANIMRLDSVQVDARTVNDVKVSEDGNITIISREGASNRKNGLVILDSSNPRDVKILSRFDENMTGGVHNVFIDKGYVYALSGGQKYYIINIKDPKNPFAVGKFELNTPGHAIHDVWIEDGIAYSSNWSDGVQLVDVGNGIAGGSPENPVQFASYAYPSGANHAAFPFRNGSTGKFYVIAGDEIFPYGLDMNGPNMAGGFLHFIDFTNMDEPEEIARFEIPFAGSHNYWVDGETLYVAYYNAGVRVVDISGELMGDLLAQGREIAFIRPSDPNGYIPNSPFTWGAQVHKGHVFYSDWNSGLWSAKVEPEKPKGTKIESK